MYMYIVCGLIINYGEVGGGGALQNRKTAGPKMFAQAGPFMRPFPHSKGRNVLHRGPPPLPFSMAKTSTSGIKTTPKLAKSPTPLQHK